MASDSELLASIDRNLSILIALEGYELVRGMTVTEGAPILRRLGMNASEIADVFETTAATVSARISEAKRKHSK